MMEVIELHLMTISNSNGDFNNGDRKRIYRGEWIERIVFSSSYKTHVKLFSKPWIRDAFGKQ